MNELVCDNETNLEIEDLGTLNQVVTEFIDYGIIGGLFYPTTCYVAVSESSNDGNNRSGFRLRGSSITRKDSIFVPYVDLNHMDIVYCGIVIRWIGFGTAFEFDNGIERIISPYLSSGTVR